MTSFRYFPLPILFYCWEKEKCSHNLLFIFYVLNTKFTFYSYSQCSLNLGLILLLIVACDPNKHTNTFFSFLEPAFKQKKPWNCDTIYSNIFKYHIYMHSRGYTNVFISASFALTRFCTVAPVIFKCFVKDKIQEKQSSTGSVTAIMWWLHFVIFTNTKLNVI